MFSDKRPSSGEIRPSSITRSVRCNFSAEFEILPPEVDQNKQDLELFEEVASEIEIEEECESSISNDNDSKSEDNKKWESPTSSSTTTPELTVEETELERKIRRGLKKINKLDKILLQKVHKEKEAKKERIALQHDFKKQVQLLIEEKGKDNVVGSQQLLSLCAASTNNNDDKIKLESYQDYVGPIFATQIDSEFYTEHTKEENIDEDIAESTDKKQSATKKNEKTTDFIKRNINLAAHANEVIALTDEEKKRLDELLADDTDLLVGENPFSTPTLKNDGFLYSIQDKQTLDDIDSKLMEYMSLDDFDQESLNQSQSLDRIGDASSDVCENVSHCGEKALDEGQNSRSMAKRLFEIEQKLNELKVTADTPTTELIDPDLLRSLLEVDSRMTSDSKSICESLRSNSELLVGGDDFTEIISIV